VLISTRVDAAIASTPAASWLSAMTSAGSVTDAASPSSSSRRSRKLARVASGDRPAQPATHRVLRQIHRGAPADETGRAVEN